MGPGDWRPPKRRGLAQTHTEGGPGGDAGRAQPHKARKEAQEPACCLPDRRLCLHDCEEQMSCLGHPGWFLLWQPKRANAHFKVRVPAGVGRHGKEATDSGAAPTGEEGTGRGDISGKRRKHGAESTGDTLKAGRQEDGPTCVWQSHRITCIRIKLCSQNYLMAWETLLIEY